MNPRKLVFVYNADSGKFNALKDALHKIIRPSTYPCSLCAVTYGNIGMKNEWKTFVDELGIPVEFLHRDEFCARFDCSDITYPVAFLNENGRLIEFITTMEFNATKTLAEFIELVMMKLK